MMMPAVFLIMLSACGQGMRNRKALPSTAALVMLCADEHLLSSIPRSRCKLDSAGLVMVCVCVLLRVMARPWSTRLDGHPLALRSASCAARHGQETQEHQNVYMVVVFHLVHFQNRTLLNAQITSIDNRAAHSQEWSVSS